MGADLESSSDDVTVPDHAGESEGAPLFLPEAISIAGSEHITNNACRDCHQAMSWWPEFMKILKLVEALLVKT